MSASPGRLGGLRGLVHVRSILGNIGVLVLPDQIAVSEAHGSFTPDGKHKDAKDARVDREPGPRAGGVSEEARVGVGRVDWRRQLLWRLHRIELALVEPARQESSSVDW